MTHLHADRPWMAALETQFAAMRYAGAAQHHEVPHGSLVGLRHHLRVAECYAFTRETATAIAVAARSVPLSSRLDVTVFPVPCAWWWFASPLMVPGLHPVTDQCVAVSWSLREQHTFTHTRDGFPLPAEKTEPYIGIWGWALSPTTGGLFTPFHERLLGEDTLGDLQQTLRTKPPQNAEHAQLRQASLGIWRFLLAGTAWLRQRIVSLSLGPVERHRRKQLAREHNVPLPSDVKVVQLRRLDAAAREPGAGEPIDWSCRWIVTGHWRQQPYADGTRKLIYILPFVKGPADKPLRVPTHTVYQVNR